MVFLSKGFKNDWNLTINMPSDSSLKSESIDISYVVLIKKIKKCEAN